MKPSEPQQQAFFFLSGSSSSLLFSPILLPRRLRHIDGQYRGPWKHHNRWTNSFAQLHAGHFAVTTHKWERGFIRVLLPFATPTGACFIEPLMICPFLACCGFFKKYLVNNNLWISKCSIGHLGNATVYVFCFFVVIRVAVRWRILGSSTVRLLHSDIYIPFAAVESAFTWLNLLKYTMCGCGCQHMCLIVCMCLCAKLNEPVFIS